MLILDSRGKKKLSLLITVIILLTVILIMIIVPKVEIALTLQKKLFKNMYEFTPDPSITALLTPLNRVPARKLTADDRLDTLDHSIIFKKLSLIIMESDLLDFLIAKISEELPQTENVLSDTLTYQLSISEANNLHLKAYVEVTTTGRIDLEKIKTQLRGKPHEAALEYLRALQDIESILYAPMPRSFPFVPFLTERIIITVK